MCDPKVNKLLNWALLEHSLALHMTGRVNGGWKLLCGYILFGQEYDASPSYWDNLLSQGSHGCTYCKQFKGVSYLVASRRGQTSLWQQTARPMLLKPSLSITGPDCHASGIICRLLLVSFIYQTKTCNLFLREMAVSYDQKPRKSNHNPLYSKHLAPFPIHNSRQSQNNYCRGS